MLRTGTRKEGGHENCVFRTHTLEHENIGCKVLIGDITVSETHTSNRDQNAMWRCIQPSAMVDKALNRMNQLECIRYLIPSNRISIAIESFNGGVNCRDN